MKLRRWRWRDPIYGAGVVLLRGSGVAALHWLTATFGSVTEFDGSPDMAGQTAWVERDGKRWVVIWFPAFSAAKVEDLSMLAHESYHAADFVLSDRGLKPSDDSDEAYAYYLSWVFRECLKRLKR